ncbi:MAG: glycosyltransferase family 2 protein [Deltaproteobacteria bacterium]
MTAESPPRAGDDLPLSLVVFAFNEASNVPVVLPEILAWLRSRRGPYQLVFLDDGSTDGTRAHALSVCEGDPRCTVISHPRNRGIGAALKTAVRAATLDWVSFLPCDGQIPVREIGVLTGAAVREGVRVVFSVYRARDDGLHRKVLSAGVRGLIFAVHGVVMRSDGPYLFRRELFDPDVLAPDSFFLNFEFPIRMLRAHERFATETIECVPRISGTSKSTGWKRIAGVGRDLLDLRLRLWRERRG